MPIANTPPLFFLSDLSLEPLASALRNKGDINHVKVGDNEHKTLLYADEALVFLIQLERSDPAILLLINNFSNLSGYTIK